ncbi:helix-turn-helix transcriptional regulator [Burkholderia sp. WAC0059]|uniref:helix-turn-helix transcriptional regulator n=1 Tax=Burkholderia sp. WAC0059 TaxID=2066022 RepID=UPI0011AFAB20|nr:helix-turn-helix transcriptional regulator [Burkholderia sp. WAC0059]
MFWAYPVSKWFHCGEYFDEAFVRENRFFQEYAIPLGRRYVSACKLIGNDAVTVIFACLRRAEQGPFDADALALLERLTPHLARAAQLQVSRYVFSTDTLVSHAFMNRWRQPVMLVTTNGEVLRSNEAARRLLGATTLVHLDGRFVALAGPHHERFIDDIGQSEIRLRGGEAGALDEATRFRVMRIVEPAGNGATAPEDVLYAFYNLMAPADGASARGLRAIAMLVLYHPRSAPPVDERLLATAFDLTPAECRIAHLLVEGLTQKEIAARVGVQHDTVRKQLQSIFQKTSTHRQPELLRLLLHLPGKRVPDRPDRDDPEEG